MRNDITPIFESLIGDDFVYEFFGVDNNMFCVGCDAKQLAAFEAIEDPSDGYRSYLECISVPEKSGIFFSTPICSVKIIKRTYGADDCIGHTSGFNPKAFSGYEFIDVNDNHVWLRIGTDHMDNYYPCFVFDYRPRGY